MNCSKYPNLIRWISTHACGRMIEDDPMQREALAALNEFDAMLACGDKNEFVELVKLRWRYGKTERRRLQCWTKPINHRKLTDSSQ